MREKTRSFSKKTIPFFLAIFSFLFLFFPSQAAAECYFDVKLNREVCTNPTPTSVFGSIEAPEGVAQFNQKAGADASNIGLMLFISNALKLASAVAGIWVMFNFITAGFTYITAAGDKGAYDKIGNQLTLSVVGLVLIVGAYTIAGILGLIIFGDASYIINPSIPTAI